MFAIYDDQGRYFRSTLEDLYRVENITPIKRPKPVAADEEGEGETARFSLPNEAIRAYRNVIEAKHEEAIYHAQQIMKRPVVTVTEESSLAECYGLMEEKNIKQLPVLNGAGKPVGLLTKENLLKVLLVDGITIRHADIDTIIPLITQPMITADPVADIRRVAQVMFDRRLNCIPVTDRADNIVGIITKTDIIHAVSAYPAITLWA